MSKRPKREDEPSAPPPVYTQPQDFSYLEIVMELQKSMAQLTEKVSNLAEASRDHSTSLKLLREDVHGAKVGLKVLLAVGSVVGGGTVTLLYFFLNKIWDAVSLYISTHPH